MTKYDITQMADYVRGLMDPVSEQRVQDYLESSSASSAKKQFSALRHVARLAETDRQFQVPDDAVRCVKALGSIRRPEVHEVSLLKRMTMALTFDSQVAPAVAGTRDMRSADRQLVFQSQGFQIDLRLENDANGSVVVGQVVRDGEEVEPMVEVAVLAMAQDQVLARSQTGAFGEFQAEGLNADSIDLLFLIDDELCLEISLGDSD